MLLFRAGATAVEKGVSPQHLPPPDRPGGRPRRPPNPRARPGPPSGEAPSAHKSGPTSGKGSHTAIIQSETGVQRRRISNPGSWRRSAGPCHRVSSLAATRRARAAAGDAGGTITSPLQPTDNPCITLGFWRLRGRPSADRSLSGSPTWLASPFSDRSGEEAAIQAVAPDNPWVQPGQSSLLTEGAPSCRNGQKEIARLNEALAAWLK
jgi:hypothetical protein